MMSQIDRIIEDVMGAKPISSHPLGGGCIADVRLISLGNGEKIVAKIGSAGDALDLEGRMLQRLGTTKTVPVPDVLYAADDLLLISHIPTSGGITKSAEIDAAQKIAKLHRVTQDNFGFDEDTVIGGLHQPNPATKSWIEFFRNYRLLYMADVANKAGQLSTNILSRLEKFSEKLDGLLLEPKNPSLLHGDLWTGNILCDDGKLSGVIDPAIYFGSPEIELAFTTLFNTFGRNFFDAYHEINSIQPDFFETRLEVYNLYPLLVHVRLFGASYLSGIEKVLRRHGC